MDDEREEPRSLYCHLLLCRSVWFDHNRPEAGFGLAGIYTHVGPDDGGGYPFRFAQMFVYAQVWGDPGEYRFQIRIVRIDADEYDGEEEVQLGANGGPRVLPIHTERPFVISGLSFVEEFAFAIGPIPFRQAGVYEFQLWAEGISEPVGRNRIRAEL